jgi:ornithine carbamoyltransferase
MADIFTVMEHKGSYSNLNYAWIGDGNNMANTWIEAAAIFGFPLKLACPKGYEPDKNVIAWAKSKGAELILTNDPKEAILGADVVSTDVWASMGQESEQKAREKAFQGYCLDDSLMANAKPDALVLHCLPAHRGEEISESVLEGKNSVVWDEAENRLHVQKAIMVWLLGKNSQK